MCVPCALSGMAAAAEIATDPGDYAALPPDALQAMSHIQSLGRRDFLMFGSIAASLVLASLEREAMRRALDECAGNVRLAAKRLGISRATLYRRIHSGEV